MVENSNLRDDDIQEANASPENPTEAVTPTQSSEQMNAEAKRLQQAVKLAVSQTLEGMDAAKAEKARLQQEEEIRLQSIRMKYYYEQFGYKGDPDPRTFGLIGGIESRNGELITALKDGKTAVIDNGKKLHLNTSEFTDDAGQILAAQILAKQWGTIKVGGNQENRIRLAAHILSQDPNAKIKGIEIDQQVLSYAQMLRETRKLGNGPGASPDRKEPILGNIDQASPSSSAGTPDFPAGGEKQQDFEGRLSAMAAKVQQRIDNYKLRRLDKKKIQTEVAMLHNINHILGTVQRVSAEGSDAQKQATNKMIGLISKGLDNAGGADTVREVLNRGSGLADEIQIRFVTPNVRGEPGQKKPKKTKQNRVGPTIGDMATP